jgi:hypothetical protein
MKGGGLLAAALGRWIPRKNELLPTSPKPE